MQKRLRRDLTAFSDRPHEAVAKRRLVRPVEPLFTAILSLIVVFGAEAAEAGDHLRVLPAAHAHNDYLHERPLLDALSRGFCSVEVDIFLVDGDLLVAHDRSTLDKRHTLKALYLDPLRERIRANSGRVHRDVPVFTLLIDIKDDGETTYAALHTLLTKYAGMLCEVRGGKYRARAVKVLISGHRPMALMKAQALRFAAIDGRIADLESTEPVHLLPMISDKWSKVFQWRGRGTISPGEAAKLRNVVRKAHAAGRLVRFWGTPEEPALWKVLLDAGVDRLSTDDLPRLQKFLLGHGAPAGAKPGLESVQ